MILIRRQSAQQILAICLTLILAGCGPSAGDPGPGGVTVEDARSLDAAAAKLDAQLAAPKIPAVKPRTQSKQKAAVPIPKKSKSSEPKPAQAK